MLTCPNVALVSGLSLPEVDTTPREALGESPCREEQPLITALYWSGLAT